MKVIIEALPRKVIDSDKEEAKNLTTLIFKRGKPSRKVLQFVYFELGKKNPPTKEG